MADIYDQFATPDDMEKRTQGAITSISHPFLEDEIAAATGAIREACGWHVAPVKSLTYEHNGSQARRVFLPAMSISTISAVTVDGVEFDVSKVEFDKNTGWTNLIGRRVAVSFTAGFPEVPPVLRSMALQVAARSLGSPMGATREQTLVSSVSWSTVAAGVSGGVAVLDHERAVLAPYILGPIP